MSAGVDTKTPVPEPKPTSLSADAAKRLANDAPNDAPNTAQGEGTAGASGDQPAAEEPPVVLPAISPKASPGLSVDGSAGPGACAKAAPLPNESVKVRASAARRMREWGIGSPKFRGSAAIRRHFRLFYHGYGQSAIIRHINRAEPGQGIVRNYLAIS